MNQNIWHPFNRTLTLFPLIMLGIAYMVPMTVFSTYGIVTQTTHGGTAQAYIVALIAMLFTASSYGKMVIAYPMAGSAYTYTKKSIETHLGFLVGWAVLLDYLFLPMINVLLAEIFLSSAFPSIPKPIWVIILISLFTSINLLGNHLTVTVNRTLVLFQLVVTGVFVFFAIKSVQSGMGLGTLWSLLPFHNSQGSFSLIMAGASILCLSFLGFDSVTTLSEETINPQKNVPNAIFLIALIGGVLFTFVSYIIYLVYPDYTKFKIIDSAAFEIAELIGGATFAVIFLAAMVIGAFASSTSSQASAARLLFAMGRDHMLPTQFFCYIHPRFNTPFLNILLIGALSLLAMLFDLVTVASLINFGALVAFTFVNLSVIFHYYIHKKTRGLRAMIHYVLMPLLGTGFVLWLWINLNKYSMILGCFWVMIGFIYLLFLTNFFRKKPPEFHFNDSITSQTPVIHEETI